MEKSADTVIEDNHEDGMIIHPKNTLRDKVRLANGDVPSFDEVNNGLAALGDEFRARLPDEIKRMRDELAAFSAASSDEDLKMKLFRRVHDLKGQAGTFGYDLLTTIGNDLCRYIERPIAFNERRLAVIGFYLEAFSRIQAENITGDGDRAGRKMVETLRSLTAKVLAEDA